MAQLIGLITILLISNFVDASKLFNLFSLPSSQNDLYLVVAATKVRRSSDISEPIYFSYLRSNQANCPTMIYAFWVGYYNHNISNLRVSAPRGHSGYESFLILHPFHDMEYRYERIVNNMHHVAIMKWNPTFLFEHIPHPLGRQDFKPFAGHYMGATKLFLFNLNYPNCIFVPCIPCSTSSPRKRLITSVKSLDEEWLAANKNLVGVSVYPNYLLKDRSLHCDLDSSWTRKLTVAKECRIKLASDHFNFTLEWHNALFKHEYSDVLNYPRVYRVLERDRFPFSLSFHVVKFIVRQYPTTFNSMDAFLTPFESEVWCALLVFSVIIALIIPLSHDTTISPGILTLAAWNLISVNTNLLRQTGGYWLSNFKSKRAGVCIITVWLLCGCSLTTDNLYTGSIFSILSAPSTPRVPEMFQDLANSDLSIVTRNNRIRNGEQFSLLAHQLIPTVTTV